MRSFAISLKVRVRPLPSSVGPLRLGPGSRGLAWVLCLVLAASGCGSYSELATSVTGSVTIDGKPTRGTAVFFIPTDEAKHAAGVIGQGYTDSAGKFVLENPRGEKTFFSGEFKVTFTRYVTKDGKPIPLTMKPSDAGGTQVLPERYMTPAETPFTVEVSAEKTDFSFALESK